VESASGGSHAAFIARPDMANGLILRAIRTTYGPLSGRSGAGQGWDVTTSWAETLRGRAAKHGHGCSVRIGAGKDITRSSVSCRDRFSVVRERRRARLALTLMTGDSPKVRTSRGLDPRPNLASLQ
jgi:hypothetical protein